MGASGVKRETVAMLEAMLAKGLTPVVPSQGSVGASGDLAALSHMAAAMIGVGAIEVGGKVVPAADALAEAGLTPLDLGPKEGLALLNGTQFSTANALAGPVPRRNRVPLGADHRRALDRSRQGSDAPSMRASMRCAASAGQREVGDTLRNLMAGSAIRASHAVDDPRVQDHTASAASRRWAPCSTCCVRPRRRSASRQAAFPDNPLIFADTDEALSGAISTHEPVAFAADMIAMALCEIGSISERRIAMLVDPALSGLPAF